ncbi:MAG: hypothetical protein PF442_01530 [Desulfobulbaceae bacterium]|nr:hypothetical protein [Desulfobulbaceae bacterium]
MDISNPGTNYGDVMLAQISFNAAYTMTTVPAGWTLKDTKTSGTITQAIYYKVATGAETSTYTWTASGKHKWAGGIIAYRGVDTASPIHVYGGQANVSSRSVTAPSLPTTVDSTMLVGFFGTDIVTTFSGVIPPGIPPGMAKVYSDNSGGGVTIFASDETWPTAGDTGNRVATAAATAVNIGHLVALKPATSVWHHLQILVPGETAAPGTATGKTGTPADQDQGVSFTVTVNLVDANWNPVTGTDTIRITSSDTAAYLPAEAALVSGTIDFNVTLNTPGLATVTASDVTDSSKTADTSPEITVNLVQGSFNAYEVGTGGIVGVIKTKVAGTLFSLDIVAIKNGAVDTSYKKEVEIKLLDSSDNSGVFDAYGCRSSWDTTTPIQILSPNTQFVGGDQGIKKEVSFQEDNSYPDVRVWVKEVAGKGKDKIGCSGNNFAIRPASFSSISVQDGDWETAGTTRTLSNTGASGGNVHKAGRPFRITATAINGEATPQTTTNYTGSPAPNITAYLEPATGTAGTFTIGASAVSGVMTSTIATYDDVGSFEMQLEDLSFADVDFFDSSDTERHIISPPFYVGRFVPDHFDVTASNTPELKTFNDAVCASRSFTYIGQPFGYATLPRSLVTAKNYSGNTIVNYTGSLQKIAPADVTQTYTNADAGSTPVLDSGSIGAPTITDNNLDDTITVTQAAAGTLEYTRVTGNLLSGTDVPFNANISLDVSVTDDSETEGPITSSTTATFNGSGSGIGFDSGNEFRYGLLILANNFGPETEALEMPLLAQYYDGSSFIPNPDDACSVFNVGDLACTSLIAPIVCTDVTVSGVNVGNGQDFTITPIPFNTNTGTLEYTLTVPSWLQYEWDDPADNDYVDNPSATATFGIYRGNDRIINWREILR